MRIKHENMIFNFDDESRALVSFGLQGATEKNQSDSANLISLDCKEYATPYFINSCGATPKNLTSDTDILKKENSFQCIYHYERDLLVTSDIQFIDAVNFVRQQNTVVNRGTESTCLTHFSSAHIVGIDNFGKLKWNDEGKLKIHYCKSRWCGEGHWYEKTPMELDLYPAADGNGGYTGAFQFSSKGTWTTSKYYPMVVIEDMECGVCYYLEMEDTSDWTIEIGYICTLDGGKFYIEANGADYENTGWKYELKPGEAYKTASVVYGCVKGDFDSAIRETTKFKRKENMAIWPNESPYVVFNDFMNCLSGRPTDKNSIPLIDAAAAAGAEVYCMDAGWYAKPIDGLMDGLWDRTIGTWVHNDNLFGNYGLKGIIDYIKSKGIIPGIWTELECFNKGTPLHVQNLYLKAEDGSPLYGAGGRFFADMTNPIVCKFLEEAITRLYKMGIRYIKNDYNASTRVGPCIDGKSSSESNRILRDATKSFFIHIKNKYPDLMIENCGSGAMRSDNSLLKIFNIQSSSDEEMYYLNPSIVAGSAALYPPEKAGNWVYPFPCISDPKRQKYDFLSKEYLESMKDGEETVFNVINGLCGVVYLSGRIDVADAFNLELIKTGINVFKKYRNHLIHSYPVYPCGKVQRNGNNTAFGMLSDDNKLMTLAVWRLSEKENIIKIDLNKYGNIKNAELIYPINSVETNYTYCDNILSITLPKTLSARYFKIEF